MKEISINAIKGRNLTTGEEVDIGLLSGVQMADNTEGGVDITVNGVTKTLAENSRFFKNNLNGSLTFKLTDWTNYLIVCGESVSTLSHRYVGSSYLVNLKSDSGVTLSVSSDTLTITTNYMRPLSITRL